MKRTLARINLGGNQFATTEIELYTTKEAKEILKDKDWIIGADAYDVEYKNKKIATSAEFVDIDENGNQFINSIFFAKLEI